VVAKASRLDLAWMAEEQALLALPLVPVHENEDCGAAVASQETGSTQEREDGAEDAEHAEGATTHQPFQNLRDLLRKQ
jgi:uncharacterized metal-binding protein YceD (DUF177 family)